ncbi:PAS domain S-box protein, partial [Klebsiella pneumoniae]|uniref:PAS domain S-box protein n=1 Tax=Klebsiella pneumoniae TaxID=573 RepID=UPI0030132D89
HPDDAQDVGRVLAESKCRQGHTTMSARFRHTDGGWRHLETIVDNRLSDPSVRSVVLSMRDVTARKALEDELRHQAFHDALTGL